MQMRAQPVSRYAGLAVALQVWGTPTGTRLGLLRCMALCTANSAIQPTERATSHVTHLLLYARTSA